MGLRWMDGSGESIVGVICAQQRQHCVSILIKRHVFLGLETGICKHIAKTRVKIASFFFVRSVSIVWVFLHNEPVILEKGFYFNHATYQPIDCLHLEMHLGNLALSTSDTIKSTTLSTNYEFSYHMYSMLAMLTD